MFVFQMELLIRFPPSEEDNLPVWRHILLKALSQEVRQCVETEIIGIAQRLTLNWQTKGHKLGHVAKLVRTMKVNYLGRNHP